MGFSLGKYLSCGCNPLMHHTSLLLIRPNTAGQLVEGDHRGPSSLLFAVAEPTSLPSTTTRSSKPPPTLDPRPWTLDVEVGKRKGGGSLRTPTATPQGRDTRGGGEAAEEAGADWHRSQTV